MPRFRLAALLSAAALALLAGAAGAQNAVSILRGSLADSLAERAGEGPGRRGPRAGNSEPVSEGLATLSEDQIEGRQRPRAPDAEADDKRVDGASGASTADDDDDDESDGDDSSASVKLRSGYDTNYDEDTPAEASRFVELSGEGSLTRRLGETDVFLSGEATLLDLPDLAFDKRFFAEIDAGARRELAKGVFLQAAAGASLDGLDDPILASPALAVALQVVRPTVALALRASVDGEETAKTRFADNEDGNVDYARASFDTTLVLRPQARIAPVISARVSRVLIGSYASGTSDDTDDEDDDASDLETDVEDGVDALAFIREAAIDGLSDEDDDDEAAVFVPRRDAVDLSAAGGLRLKPADSLTLTLALRANRRDFDAAGLASLTNFFPDIAFTWDATDDLSVSASIARIIDQPEENESRAQDVRAYAAEIDYDPDTGFGFGASAGFSQVREFGTDADSDESFVELTARYKPSKRATLEVNLLQSWTDDRSSDNDNTKSTQVSGGLRANF